MPFHIKRTETFQAKPLQQYRGIRSTVWVQPPSGKSVLEIQTTHTPTALQKVPDEKNYLTPPPHWHWYQDEFFHIRKGRYIFTLEGVDKTISASDPQPIRIPAGARHTFKVDDTCEDECVIEVSTLLSPKGADEGAGEKFFRNIYSYLDDCYLQDVSPSLPQLLLMLDSAEISLALPGPGWVARPLSWILGVVVGRWFGGYVLGYRDSYEEYWSEKEGRKAK
ncbi:putative oxidoreductase patJ [Pseudocercospora fuligena]|uniref:Putative oxidoreductase patJ n=1 Tax=Pseudocercospora fuligena TaxID=685502 RepID=A0A8H6VEN5_9PEZI|nr:putative oxidoreductase patJ [Pseudocercospora fuligena]